MLRKFHFNDDARHLAMSALKKLESGALFSALFAALGFNKGEIATGALIAFVIFRAIRVWIKGTSPQRRRQSKKKWPLSLPGHKGDIYTQYRRFEWN